MKKTLIYVFYIALADVFVIILILLNFVMERLFYYV